MDVGKIYEKYCNGDPITNEELEYGIKEYERISNSLNSLGQRFQLAWREVYRVLNGLRDFKIARARK